MSFQSSHLSINGDRPILILLVTYTYEIKLEESSRKHNFEGKSIWPVVFRELYENHNHGMAIEIAVEKEPPREIFWRCGHYKALRIGEMKMQVANIPNRINQTQDPYEYDNLALSVFNITSQDEMRPSATVHFISFVWFIK